MTHHVPPLPIALVAISGPTCAGKTTLARSLLRSCPDLFTPVITTTTRPPRPHEMDGRDYHFLDHRTFQSKLASGALLEHDVVASHLYGLESAELERVIRANQIGIAVTTPSAIAPARSLCESFGTAVLTVYLSASPATLVSRLLQRFREDREDRALHYAERLLQMLASYESLASAESYDIAEHDFVDASLPALIARVHNRCSPAAPFQSDVPDQHTHSLRTC